VRLLEIDDPPEYTLEYINCIGTPARAEGFDARSFVITKFHEVPALGEIGKEEFMKQALNRTDSANWILQSIVPLEEKIGPFLNFHEL
jgi:hypothetical protein